MKISNSKTIQNSNTEKKTKCFSVSVAFDSRLS